MYPARTEPTQWSVCHEALSDVESPSRARRSARAPLGPSSGTCRPLPNSTMKKDRAKAEKHLKTFIAKFDAKNQSLIRAVRALLRRRFPAANEMVYDNYNFFVIGY